MKLKFLPFVSVGDIYFGELINKYIDSLNLVYEPDDSGIGIETYVHSGLGISLNISALSKRIEFIICKHNLFYLAKNIIGMNIVEFITYTNEKYYGDIDIADFEEDGVPQYIYEFDDIGLQIWVKNGIIVTAIAASKE